MRNRMIATLFLSAMATLAACNPQTPVPPADPVPSGPTRIINWGQRSTHAGQAFNVQADGNSGISFELSRPVAPGSFAISFDGRPLTGVAASGVIVTGTIPPNYLTTPGRYPVVLENVAAGIRLEAGDFTVEPATTPNP
jgi:hypothetical protein